MNSMMAGKDKLLSVNGLFTIIYSAIILCTSIYLVRKPEFNWDILPYMGVVLSYDHADAKTVHDKVYSIAKENIPAREFQRMIDPSNPYRASVANDASAFQQQLPFYVVKPLYTWSAYLFYKNGFSLPTATVLPSALSFFLIGLLLFYWIKKYWPISFAFVTSLLVMFSAPLLSVAKLSTPDALSGLLLFASLYFIFEKRSLALMAVFLLLAVFTRLDNIIPALFIITAIFFSNKWQGKIDLKKYSLFVAMVIACYFIISFNAHSFGWSLFYYPSFIKQMNVSYESRSTFSIPDYIALAKSQFMTGLFFSSLSFFLLVMLFLFTGTSSLRFSQLSLEQSLSLTFILIIVTRFILQPLIADRLYIPYYLSVIVFLTKKYSFATGGQFYNR